MTELGIKQNLFSKLFVYQILSATTAVLLWEIIYFFNLAFFFSDNNNKCFLYFPYASTGEAQESMNNVSCRRDMTEILLKAA